MTHAFESCFACAAEGSGDKTVDIISQFRGYRPSARLQSETLLVEKKPERNFFIHLAFSSSTGSTVERSKWKGEKGATTAISYEWP